MASCCIAIGELIFNRKASWLRDKCVAIHLLYCD